MSDENHGWKDARTEQPPLDKFVLALWMPPHCPEGERVVVLGQRRRTDWEIAVGRLCAGAVPCFNRAVLSNEISWWRECAPPEGVKFATGR